MPQYLQLHEWSARLRFDMNLQGTFTLGCEVLAGKARTMKVHVLKMRGQDNLDEMEQGIEAGHTVGGWQMPKTAVPGDLAVWYAASPDQDYRAWGWVVDFPKAGFRESSRLYMGPVGGIRRIEPVKPRHEIAEACGFNRDSVAQQAQTVPDEVADDFLRALGLRRRLVAARELISDEMARVLSSLR